jgi:hypothetical protein
MISKYLPKNTICVVVSLDEEDGHPIIDSFSNLTDELSEEENSFLALLLKGLGFSIATGGDQIASIGNVLALLDHYEDSEVEFEPDEELVEKLQDAKIIPINGKHRPN